MSTVRDWLAARMRQTDASTAPARLAPAGPGGDNGPELSAQQRAAVVRGADVVRRYGGVVLADAVGLGKTRVAVATARRVVSDTRRRSSDLDPVLFVVPARLREDWREAIGAAGWQCGRDVRLVSHHQLSRTPCQDRPPVVVVDEAHRFRNPKAKRSRHLAMLTARTPPILVTATPVCTDRSDLRQLLSYFLTDPVVESLVGMGLTEAFEAHEAGQFDVVELLEEVVIRRSTPDFGASGRPDVHFELLHYEPTADEAWLWNRLEGRLKELTLEATGDYWPRGLLINNLLRMWESGAAALRTSLQQLVHYHERWLEAADNDCRIERPDFRAIFGGVDPRQQTFPFLYETASRGTPDEARRRDVEADYRALQSLLERVDTVAEGGAGIRNAVVEAIVDDPDQQFLIFAAFRASATSMFEALADRGVRVGLVTGDEAKATGLGRTPDREVLRRFRTDGPRRATLRVLVATDCLAEGVNLQGCTNVVLADLPYSPVRLEQRIGRIARPGADVGAVTVYLVRPRSWNDSLGMRRTITERLQMADRLGVGQRLLDGVGLTEGGDQTGEDDDSSGPLAAMTLQEQLRTRLTDAGGPDGVSPFARVSGVSEGQEQLWVRVEIRAGPTRRVWLWIPSEGEEPVVRLSEQIPGLARLSDDRRPVRRWKPEGRLWERALGWVEKRKSVLEAARLAPPLLGGEAAPTRAWQTIREAVRDGSLEAGDERLGVWRRRLLRAHPPGLQYELEALLEDKPEPRRLIRWIEQLDEPRRTGPVDVEIVAGLLSS